MTHQQPADAGMPPMPARRFRTSGHRACAAACGLIVLLVAAVYLNSLDGVFLFDDFSSIRDNPTIRSFNPPWGPLFPPKQSTTSGRPLLNLSFALNHAAGGMDARGYHLANIAIHALAALVLFGLVRRTLGLRAMRGGAPAGASGDGGEAVVIAAATAILWALHPLQTESVAYIVQRAESLVGLFYLLMLYCLARGLEPGASVRWFAAAVAACFAGMASKEVMATAPLIALLYDRTFAAGSFREALRRRWRVHASLAAGWLLLAALVLGTASRDGTVGFGSADIRWWSYALKQCEAVVHYLRLSVWPHPLVFDYGVLVVDDIYKVLPQALLLLLLGAATLWALRRRPAAGFLGAWFFVILAPSSSIVPVVTQSMAEHRMYLPLAAVTTGLVLCVRRLAGRAALPVLAVVVVLLGWRTVERNADYSDPLRIWSKATVDAPGNFRAYNNHGLALADLGRHSEAITCYRKSLLTWPGCADDYTCNNMGASLASLGRKREAAVYYRAALRLRKENPEVENNLGHLLAGEGRNTEAIAHFRRAITLRPGYINARISLGELLVREGRSSEAVAMFRSATELEPGFAPAHDGLGSALAAAGRIDEAVREHLEAIRLAPDTAMHRYNLACTLQSAGRDAEAAERCKEALQIDPGLFEARVSLGSLLGSMGRTGEALAHLEEAVRLRPDSAEAHNNLAIVLGDSGRVAEAAAHYREAVRLKPGYFDALYNLAMTLLEDCREEEALPCFEEALRVQPASPEAQLNLGLALARLGRLGEARRHFEEALRLQPGCDDALLNLRRLEQIGR